jgi:cation transport regulator ChaB
LKSRGVLSMVDLSYKWDLPASVREQLEEEFFLLPAVSRETEFFRNVLGYAINPWKAVEGRDEDSRKLAIVKLASSNRVKKPEDNKDKV